MLVNGRLFVIADVVLIKVFGKNLKAVRLFLKYFFGFLQSPEFNGNLKYFLLLFLKSPLFDRYIYDCEACACVLPLVRASASVGTLPAKSRGLVKRTICGPIDSMNTPSPLLPL